MAIDWNEVWKSAVNAGLDAVTGGGKAAKTVLKDAANAFKQQLAETTEAFVTKQIDRSTYDFEIESAKRDFSIAVDRAKILGKATINKAVDAIFKTLIDAVATGIRF